MPLLSAKNACLLAFSLSSLFSHSPRCLCIGENMPLMDPGSMDEPISDSKDTDETGGT